MKEKAPSRVASLQEAHQAFGLPKPQHPLISVLNSGNSQIDVLHMPHTHVLGFYKISLKNNLGGRLKYGQTYYDFDEGGLLFASPGQIIGADNSEGSVCSAFTLLIHPDFFLGYPLAKNIKQYGFFSYATHETLHLSEDERKTILELLNMIELELSSRIDDFSQDVVVAQLELLLNYSNRFYNRQFITRKAVSNDLLQKLEDVLNEYYEGELSLSEGIPTVHFLAEKLNMSSSYLSDNLRSLTGQSAQQHIHEKLIEKAKEKLSTTNLSVSEVAYELGFEHPQSFSKLFKTKTTFSPLEFRKSFN
jgi:AraC family transcriptional activator of pobA